MSSFFDRDVLEAAINIAIEHPEKIPGLLKANGTEREDVEPWPLYGALLKELGASYARGENVVDRSLLASRLAERNEQYGRREDWQKTIEAIKGRGTLDANPLFLDRLRSLRFRRRIANAGSSVQSGCSDSDLLSRLDLARMDYETSIAAEPLKTLDLSADLPAPAEPLVGDISQQLLMPGEATAVASDPGVGKTKLLTELALGVASGTEALGFPCRQQPVVYVTSDGDPDFERNLRRQWAARGPGACRLADLPLYALTDDAFCLADPTWYGRLIKTLETAGATRGPVACFIESLATNVLEPEDLNDQVRVRRFVNATIRRLMRVSHELTLSMSCHLRKQNPGGANDLGTRVAGSIQIRGAFDSVIGLVSTGRDAFTVRRIKRSRSGGDFEAFKVQILGGRTEPLRLQNEGQVDVRLEELRGAARTVMDTFRRTGGPKTVDELVVVVQGFGKRAIQGACKRLAEAEKPRLVRVSKKPARYDLAPEATDAELGSID